MVTVSLSKSEECTSILSCISLFLFIILTYQECYIVMYNFGLFYGYYLDLFCKQRDAMNIEMISEVHNTVKNKGTFASIYP